MVTMDALGITCGRKRRPRPGVCGRQNQTTTTTQLAGDMDAEIFDSSLNNDGVLGVP
jgi:hypothetical protein